MFQNHDFAVKLLDIYNTYDIILKLLKLLIKIYMALVIASDKWQIIEGGL